jgi:uncharacterized protein YigE (DUF2233 family)
MEYERSAYTIYEVDLRQQTIRLYWKRPDGTPYAYLSALPRPLEGEAGKMLFATNDVLSPGSTNADRSRNPANGARAGGQSQAGLSTADSGGGTRR